MVVTSAFHQLRSYLTFRCAVRQSLPPEQRIKVPNEAARADGFSCFELHACGMQGGRDFWPTSHHLFLTCTEQVWVAHVPAEGLPLNGLRLQRIFSAWDFWRELAAIGYYFLRGWLC